MSERRIVEAYQDAEVWLLRLIADAVARGAAGTAGVYGGRLDALQAVLRRAESYMEALEAGLLSEVGGAILEGYEDGVARALATIPGEPVVPAGSVTALALETTTALSSQRQQILRSVSDAYREIVRTVSIRQTASGMNIDTAMQSALDKFAARGITSFTDNSGRRWGIDTYSRMALRTATNRAANQGRADSFQANNIDLILVSWHRACSPMCLPFQGRTLSLTRGPGIYTVQDRVTGGETTVEVVENRARAIERGFLHANCRHTESAHIPGMPAPEVPDVDPQEHEELQRQRAIERHIRGWKKRSAVALTPQAQQQASAKVKAWQKAQRQHVDQHPFLRRNYSREQVRTGNPANAS